MKLKVWLAVCFLLLFAASSGAAAPDIEWQKTLGGSGYDRAQSIQQTNDGGFIVAGYTNSNDGDVSGNNGGLWDAWVVKLDSAGEIEWQRCLGGSRDEIAYSIQQTSDGGYIVAGFTNSNDGDVSGNNGGEDAWVVKLDSAGGIEWQRCLGGSGSDGASSVQQTSDGGFIVAGATYSNDGDVSGNNGNLDAWVVKLDSTGGIEWQRCIGGYKEDHAYYVQQTSDDGYIVAGFTESNDGDVSGNNGGWDAWVVKLDSAGGIEWQRCIGGSEEDHAYYVQQTGDGGYIFAGSTRSNDGDVSGNNGSRDAWVVKLGSAGEIEWQKCIGGSQWDEAFSIRQTSDGGFIVAGYTQSNDGDVSGNNGEGDAWVVKLAPNHGE
ncbi:MAG: hypothetical protein FWG71_11075 [Synergistaceae bacterium]|nr:hypothetical protein [Synergistaceae bacterium]